MKYCHNNLLTALKKKKLKYFVLQLKVQISKNVSKRISLVFEQKMRKRSSFTSYMNVFVYVNHVYDVVFLDGNLKSCFRSEIIFFVIVHLTWWRCLSLLLVSRCIIGPINMNLSAARFIMVREGKIGMNKEQTTVHKSRTTFFQNFLVILESFSNLIVQADITKTILSEVFTHLSYG